MGKTVQIDDDVMRVAERLAAERGTTPGEVISEVARKALAEPAGEGHVGPAGAVLTKGWYVLPRRGGPPVTSELVQRLLDEADLEDAGIKRSG
ncbi:MAG: CopG family transcriptional regulator [Pseudolabrys sp.]|nr:CopG family transcriptional regulator [Pseudolabrys sp.]